MLYCIVRALFLFENACKNFVHKDDKNNVLVEIIINENKSKIGIKLPLIYYLVLLDSHNMMLTEML